MCNQTLQERWPARRTMAARDGRSDCQAAAGRCNGLRCCLASTADRHATDGAIPKIASALEWTPNQDRSGNSARIVIWYVVAAGDAGCFAVLRFQRTIRTGLAPANRVYD